MYRQKVQVKGVWTDTEKPVACGAWVYEAEDSEFFCPARAYCPFRLKARS